MKTTRWVILLGMIALAQLFLFNGGFAVQTTTNITNNNSSPVNSEETTLFAKDPAKPMTDADLTYLLQNKINNDKTLAGSSMTVAVQEGVVTIKGRAKNQAQVDQAASIVRAYPEIKNVETQVTIDSKTY